MQPRVDVRLVSGPHNKDQARKRPDRAFLYSRKFWFAWTAALRGLPLLTRICGYYRKGSSLRALLSVLRLQSFQ